MTELPDEMFDDLQERVEAGAEFLDTYKPGWREQVDPSVLEMHSCKRCVLGQLFDELAQENVCDSGFEYGAIKFLVRSGRRELGATRELGFDLPGSYTWEPAWVEWNNVAWQTLNDLWVKEIQR